MVYINDYSGLSVNETKFSRVKLIKTEIFRSLPYKKNCLYSWMLINDEKKDGHSSAA